MSAVTLYSLVIQKYIPKDISMLCCLFQEWAVLINAERLIDFDDAHYSHCRALFMNYLQQNHQEWHAKLLDLPDVLDHILVTWCEQVRIIKQNAPPPPAEAAVAAAPHNPQVLSTPPPPVLAPVVDKQVVAVPQRAPAAPRRVAAKKRVIADVDSFISDDEVTASTDEDTDTETTSSEEDDDDDEDEDDETSDEDESNDDDSSSQDDVQPRDVIAKDDDASAKKSSVSRAKRARTAPDRFKAHAVSKKEEAENPGEDTGLSRELRSVILQYTENACAIEDVERIVLKPFTDVGYFGTKQLPSHMQHIAELAHNHFHIMRESASTEVTQCFMCQSTKPCRFRLVNSKMLRDAGQWVGADCAEKFNIMRAACQLCNEIWTNTHKNLSPLSDEQAAVLISAQVARYEQLSQRLETLMNKESRNQERGAHRRNRRR